MATAVSTFSNPVRSRGLSTWQHNWHALCPTEATRSAQTARATLLASLDSVCEQCEANRDFPVAGEALNLPARDVPIDLLL